MLEEVERKTLIACKKIHTYKKTSFDAEKAASAAQQVFGDELEGVGATLASLEARGLIRRDDAGAGYLFSPEGLELAARLDLDNERSGFDEWLTKCAASRAYAELCRRVYGTSFIQFNMVDAEQIEALLGFLALKPGERLVDLGCGIGSQAEHIADRTGARVTGLDFAPAAVAAARARCATKAGQIEFVLGDLNAIALPQRSFDAAVSFDTLYFVDDLRKTVADIAGLLVPGGRLGIFYSQTKGPDSPPDILEAGGTELARALRALGLGFEAIDFTANERRIWKEERKAAQELKRDFEAEGNLELWKGRDEESSQSLAACESGSSARYLYLVRTGS
jgi:SAM-dependent methyltransferase